MGAGATAPRLREWSAVRWVLVGAFSAALGVSGWYFTMFDVFGLDDFNGSLAVSMVAFPATVLLVILDFRTAGRRGVLWAWLVLRALAVPVLGLGLGSLVRFWLVTQSGDRPVGWIDSHGGDYAWHLAGLGALLLAIQPVVAGVRRVAGAVFGARVAGWPGSPVAKGLAGTIAFAVIAAGMLTVVARVRWHIAVDTSASVPSMVATGTIDGREIAAVSYDEDATLRIRAHERVAAFDVTAGELMWDQRIPNDSGIPVTVDAVLLDDRGVFLRMDVPAGAATWFVLDPRTREIEAAAEEGNLQVIDDPGDAAPGIPGDVVQRHVERSRHVADDGYDYVFTDDADIEQVFRYDDESLVINPVTGSPAGQDHGFTLHGTCCRPTVLEAQGEDGQVLWRIEGIDPSARDVVAETDSGHVIMLVEGRVKVAAHHGRPGGIHRSRGGRPRLAPVVALGQQRSPCVAVRHRVAPIERLRGGPGRPARRRGRPGSRGGSRARLPRG